MAWVTADLMQTGRGPSRLPFKRLPQGTVIAEWDGPEGPLWRGEGLWLDAADGHVRLSVAGQARAAAASVRGGVLRLHLAWNLAARRIRAEIRVADTAVPFEAFAPAPWRPHPDRLMAGLVAARARYAAVSDVELPPMQAPCFAAGTRLATPGGPRRVETLRVGETVTTPEGLATIRWTGRWQALAAGPTAPVELRAPYFGLTEPVRVSRDHRMMIAGAHVEYVTGHDAVLIRAEDLVGLPGARLDLSRATVDYHHLMLDRPACVLAGTCQLEALLPAGQDTPPCAPHADRATAQEILAARHRHRRFAA